MKKRFDVWTDAGREPGDLFCLSRNLSPTESSALLRILKRDWMVEAREVEEGRPEGESDSS